MQQSIFFSCPLICQWFSDDETKDYATHHSNAYRCQLNMKVCKYSKTGSSAASHSIHSRFQWHRKWKKEKRKKKKKKKICWTWNAEKFIAAPQNMLLIYCYRELYANNNVRRNCKSILRNEHFSYRKSYQTCVCAASNFLWVFIHLVIE